MKNKIISTLIIFILTVIVILPIFNVCYAASNSTTDKYGLSDVKNSGVVTKSAPEVAGIIIKTILGISGVILVIVLIYGGVLYMTSGGNEDKVATAKKAITYGIVGITVIALAFAITRFVLDALIK